MNRPAFIGRLLLLFLGWAGALFAAEPPLGEARQCMLVLTENWTAKTGRLTTFERAAREEPWCARPEQAIPVVVGQAGLAWGRGLADVSGQVGPSKREGDRKAPAGVFRLSTAFGYAPATAASTVKLPYLALTADFEGIDDPRSRFYNRIVERSKVAAVDWSSSERMRRKDSLYRWGVVVEHNSAPAVPGAGSCIFLHVWRNASSGTMGCTAMEEKQLQALLAWLDPAARPVLIQLPREAYTALKADWHLP